MPKRRISRKGRGVRGTNKASKKVSCEDMNGHLINPNIKYLSEMVAARLLAAPRTQSNLMMSVMC